MRLGFLGIASCFQTGNIIFTTTSIEDESYIDFEGMNMSGKEKPRFLGIRWDTTGWFSSLISKKIIKPSWSVHSKFVEWIMELSFKYLHFCSNLIFWGKQRVKQREPNLGSIIILGNGCRIKRIKAKRLSLQWYQSNNMDDLSENGKYAIMLERQLTLGQSLLETW